MAVEVRILSIVRIAPKYFGIALLETQTKLAWPPKFTVGDLQNTNQTIVQKLVLLNYY
jgi:hypothetical protein